MKFTSLSGGIQRAGAAETAVKSVTTCFYLQLVVTNDWIQVFVS